MKKLRLFMLIENSVSKTEDCQKQNIEYLSNDLRILEWYQFPAEYFPSNFLPDGLVVLKLVASNTKQLWNVPIEPLYNLRTADLSHSTNFRKFEDFRMVPNLEKLILEGCENLREVHLFITLLERLSILNIKDFTRLENFPTSIGGLKSLKVLNLESCASLTKLPEDLGMLNSLEEFYMEGISVRDEDLPSFITLLENLRVLCYSGGKVGGGGGPSKNTTNMIVGKGLLSSACFSSLKVLKLISCGLGSGSFPENFGYLFVSLRYVDLSNNDFTCLPASFNQLSKLEYLDLSFCRDLKSLGPELPCGLNRVNLNYCISLDTIVDALGDHCNWDHARRQSSARKALTLLRRLIQNLPINRIETFSIVLPGNEIRRRMFNIVLPGNEIPSWFTHRSYEPFISLQLDPKRCNNKWVGLAFFSCFILQTINFVCDLMFEGPGFGYGLILKGQKVSAVGASLSMDHLWLSYVPCDYIHDRVNKGSHDHIDNWSRLELSFGTTYLDGEPRTNKYIRSCGVRLVYEQDIEDMDSIFASNSIENFFVG